MSLYKICCVVIGLLLLLGCGLSIIAMFYAAYTGSIQVVLWLFLALLSGMIGLILTYYGSGGE